jgi:hypothetical protein
VLVARGGKARPDFRLLKLLDITKMIKYTAE